ncbi:MAG: DUF6515 family protein [Limisphaerales bacterium]
MERRAAPDHREVERAAERTRWDIEAERRNAFYWAGFHPGMLTAALPAGCLQLSVGSNAYYYYDGIYYQTGPAGYTVVAPPVGAIVPQLPEGAETIPMGMSSYYYAAGAFYMRQLTGFAVVPAPIGVTVAGLPPGAAPVILNGATYYQSGSTYFAPVMQAGATAYVTANP